MLFWITIEIIQEFQLIDYVTEDELFNTRFRNLMRFSAVIDDYFMFIVTPLTIHWLNHTSFLDHFNGRKGELMRPFMSHIIWGILSYQFLQVQKSKYFFKIGVNLLTLNSQWHYRTRITLVYTDGNAALSRIHECDKLLLICICILARGTPKNFLSLKVK